MPKLSIHDPCDEWIPDTLERQSSSSLFQAESTRVFWGRQRGARSMVEYVTTFWSSKRSSSQRLASEWADFDANLARIDKRWRGVPEENSSRNPRGPRGPRLSTLWYAGVCAVLPRPPHHLNPPLPGASGGLRPSAGGGEPQTTHCHLITVAASAPLGASHPPPRKSPGLEICSPRATWCALRAVPPLVARRDGIHPWEGVFDTSLPWAHASAQRAALKFVRLVPRIVSLSRGRFPTVSHDRRREGPLCLHQCALLLAPSNRVRKAGLEHSLPVATSCDRQRACGRSHWTN